MKDTHAVPVYIDWMPVTVCVANRSEAGEHCEHGGGWVEPLGIFFDAVLFHAIVVSLAKICISKFLLKKNFSVFSSTHNQPFFLKVF